MIYQVGDCRQLKRSRWICSGVITGHEWKRIHPEITNPRSRAEGSRARRSSCLEWSLTSVLGVIGSNSNAQQFRRVSALEQASRVLPCSSRSFPLGLLESERLDHVVRYQHLDL